MDYGEAHALADSLRCFKGHEEVRACRSVPCVWLGAGGICVCSTMVYTYVSTIVIYRLSCCACSRWCDAAFGLLVSRW